MSKTYNICEVTVTIPSLGTIATDGAGNKIKRGEKCRVHLYAVKPDWHSGTIFEGFNVGAITFTGYTDSPFKRSQKIMVPDGYKLVALRVDDDGVPTSWDSLPVHFTGGFIESPIDELDGIADLPRYKVSSDFAIQQRIADALDTALARHYEQFGNAELGKTAVIFLADRWVAIEGGYTSDEMRDAVEYIKHRRLTKEFGKGLADLSPFAMKDGQVFIKDAFIDKSIASADYSMKVGVNHNFKGYVAGMPLSVEKHSTEREKVQAVVSKYLKGEATEYTDELVDDLMSLCRSAISIQHEGKPSSVEFKADRFAIHENAQSVIDNAIANHKTNAQVDSHDKSHVVSLGDCAGNTATAWRLSDQMHEAIINAVAESDLFKSLVSSVNAQAASIADLTQVVHSAINDALRNAAKPGGILWNKRSR